MRELILLVEDDPDDLELTLTAFRLASFPHQVEVARDGAEVLRRLRAPGPRPALVVLDLNIPKLSGLEVLERVRQDPKLADTPVVILSSSDDRREKDRAAKLGALDFLRKPLLYEDFEKVIDAINRVLATLRKGAAAR